MYDLLKKYDVNFTIDINEMVQHNVYIASKMPVNLFPILTKETIDFVIEENGLSDSLEVIVQHINLTPEHFEIILNKQYMSSQLHKILHQKIMKMNKDEARDVVIHLLNCYGSNLYSYLKDLRAEVNDFIKLLSAEELLSTKNFKLILVDNFYVSEESYKHNDLAIKLVKKLLEDKELYLLRSEINIWDIHYEYFDELFNNFTFLEKFINSVEQEKLVEIDEKYDDREYIFMDYLKNNHLESLDFLLKWHTRNDMVSNYIAYTEFGNYNRLNDDELIEMLSKGIDVISNSYINGKIYNRVLNSPKIMGELLERGVYEIWFLHHKKDFVEMRNLLADYYFDHPKDYSTERRLSLESVIIRDYFKNDHINKRFKEYVSNIDNLKNVISEIHIHNEKNLTVLLDANPSAIKYLGDINELYTKYLTFYKKDDED